MHTLSGNRGISQAKKAQEARTIIETTRFSITSHSRGGLAINSRPYVGHNTPLVLATVVADEPADRSRCAEELRWIANMLELLPVDSVAPSFMYLCHEDGATPSFIVPTEDLALRWAEEDPKHHSYEKLPLSFGPKG